MKLIFIDDLRRGMVAAENIYPPENRTVPYVRKGTALTDGMISEMRRLNIRFAYIKKPSKKGASERERVAPPPITPSRPAVSPELQKQAITTLEDTFADIYRGTEDIHHSAQIIKQLNQIVNKLVDSLISNSNLIVNINDLRSYDEYTYHHSLSVAVLAIAMAQHFGFNRDRLNQIGMCAVMHDIGKPSIPIEIINKTSRLNDSEFQIIKTHSPAGFDHLVRTGIGDDEIWRGVLYHHEKMDGTGYPEGLKGSEIPLFSRIIAAADVYDALTSNRPYRTPMLPSEAIEYLMGGVGTSFDYDVVNAFLNRVEVYPIGSVVQLSNGKRAIVLSNESQLRPVVRLESGEILDLRRDRSCLNIVISKVLDQKP